MGRWVDERLALGRFWRAVFLRHIPVGTHWWYTLGAACLFLLLLQIVTGTLLAMNYSPTPERAYDSIRFIMSEVPFGWFIRGLHHWGASAMVAVVVLHLVSAFVLGGHRYPREGIWLMGVGLFLLTIGFGFTGYLLPWDQKAYWATAVGTNMVGTVPVVGPALLKLVRGGAEVGVVTLSRFYAMHVLLFPLLVSSLAAVHLALVVYHGISVRPDIWHGGPNGEPPQSAGGTYAHRYASFKARGRPFWPDLIVEDLRTSLLVFLVLVGLTLLVGVPLDERADPTDTAYIPRPEWYFMPLFELLKYFPGSLEWVGAAAVPALLVVVLLLTPWLSRGDERRPSRRLAGMAAAGILLASGAGLTVRAYATTPPATVVERGAVLTSHQLRGRQIIQQQGCRSCHVVAGEGETRKGPPLDGIGERMTPADIHFFMEQPKRFNPAASMKPLVPPLSHEDVEAITQYLLTLEEEHLQR